MRIAYVVLAAIVNVNAVSFVSVVVLANVWFEILSIVVQATVDEVP
jgi:hypothetical protein